MSREAVPLWLTVVTVVKDDLPGLERTAASMITQGSAGVQWVIIDGSSDEDAVPALLASYPTANADYFWEHPQGVYAAMNSGLAHAQGTYVLYINAGDVLHDPGTLESLHTALAAGPSWAFGHVRFVHADGAAILPAPFDYQTEKRHAFNRGRFPPHQGTVAKTSVLRDVGGFDTRYQVAADYAAFLRLAKTCDPLELDLVLADFPTGGLSSRSWVSALSEFHIARTRELHLTGLGRLGDAMATTWLGARMAAARLLRRT